MSGAPGTTGATDGGPFDGVEQLGQANALLSALHDVVRSMSSPLSLDELIPAVRPQLQELFHPQAIVLVAGDPLVRPMRVVHAEGVRIGTEVALTDLPPVLHRGPRGRPSIVDDLAGEGLAPGAGSGAYVWLFARGRTSGLLAMELDEPGGIDPAVAPTLERLALPLALALENAVWFRRLRTLGAEEERQRLGATLHDRFAQSLAYVAMSLDRAGKRHPEDAELAQLRTDVRSTLGELRETLRELRLAVDDDRSLVDALREHLERVEDRDGVIATLQVDGEVELQPGIAQQLLRLAQELTNLAARHARATTVTVRLDHPPGRVVMEVVDDGHGREESELAQEARGRLAAVRERVDAIGGRVEVRPSPGTGTMVRIELRGST